MTEEKDLLGDPLPPTPKMTDPYPWHIYEMNDQPEYWMARSLDEAKAAALEFWGGSAEDVEGAYELSEDALDTLTLDVADYDADGNAAPISRTFREELNQRVAAGLAFPEFFAACE